jgi:uncharacterized NAD-dependent epimerase/dehydratase family protein
MLKNGDCLALVMHGQLIPGPRSQGKMGHGLLRYGSYPIAAVVDREHAGQTSTDVTDIPGNVPVVATIEEAIQLGANTLIPGIAPPGGILPSAWSDELIRGLQAGCNLINGLHKPMANDPMYASALQENRWIWDVRVEPAGLRSGTGAAAAIDIPRVLTVGTDMAIGKMTVSLECDRAAKRLGYASEFLATGQIGICISGKGIPLDAVRVDFAPGSIEQLVMDNAPDRDVLWVEGQGSVLHPASTAWLALIRGAVPTHLILCHRAGQETLARVPSIRIPPLKDVISLFETVACAGGALPRPATVGIAVNTSMLSDEEARDYLANVTNETGLPATDPVRYGADALVHAVFSK